MPAYEPNQPIPLASTSITEVDGKPADASVDAELRLLPSPLTVIRSNAVPAGMAGTSSCEIVLANGMRMDAMLSSLNMETGATSLMPARQPVDVLDTGQPLRRVDFGVLNFPVAHGAQITVGPDGATFLPHAQIEANGWRVELTGVPEIREVVEDLKRTSGYGITYSGTLGRADGASFEAQEAAELLDVLRTFLSFARGAACGITLVEGEDTNGQQSWVRWGAHHTEPWERQASWFREPDGADVLSLLFPRFNAQVEEDEGRRRSLFRAIDWYTQSNVTAPYIGIILTLASLERLAVLKLGRPKKNPNEPTGEFIRAALEQSSIPLQIPAACAALAEAGVDWKHGPQAVNGIRNDLVHSTERLARVNDYVIHEAWNLGQWYAEMMVLNMLDYHGDHMNRLARWDDYDQYVLPVPWAGAQQAT